MSKIQEFIDAWNTKIDEYIAEDQTKINEYLSLRQTLITLTDPLLLKMPTLKVLDVEGNITIDGFDVTTLGKLFEWTYPIDGFDPSLFPSGTRKSDVVKRYTDFSMTGFGKDAQTYTDGYTYGTMSYLANQYLTAISSHGSNIPLKNKMNSFERLDSLKKLKSIGGKVWFDNYMHSIYSVLFGVKLSVSKLTSHDFHSISEEIDQKLEKQYFAGFYTKGTYFDLGTKYYDAVIEAGDGFFPSQTSGTQSGTQSGVNTDYTLSVINPLSDIENKISGKIVFIESGNYIIPNSTLNGLPNPWTNPKTKVEVPNNTGIIKFNGDKSTGSKKSLADETIINLQNIIEGTYGLVIYLKYTEPDGPPVVPPSDAPVGSSASTVTGASESSVPGPTASTIINTKEFTFNVEQVDIFSNTDFGNLFIIGQEDETLLYDDGKETYGSEYVEDEFIGQDELKLEQLQDLAAQQVQIDTNDLVEKQRESAAKEDTGDTTSAPMKGSPEFKKVLASAGYKAGTLEYEFALTIATSEGWFPANTTRKASRAYRNNNPGNLDYSGEFAKIDPNVTREPGKGSRFARFSTAELGTKALIEGKIKKWASGNMPITSGNQKLIVPISDKWKKGTPPTIAQFMYTYAPPTDHNDTENYISNIIGGVKKVHSGVTRATKIKEYLA